MAAKRVGRVLTRGVYGKVAVRDGAWLRWTWLRDGAWLRREWSRADARDCSKGGRVSTHAVAASGRTPVVWSQRAFLVESNGEEPGLAPMCRLIRDRG